MAFTTAGTFTSDTQQKVTPLDQLINQFKQKKAQGAAAAPANAFAPTSPAAAAPSPTTEVSPLSELAQTPAVTPGIQAAEATQGGGSGAGIPEGVTLNPDGTFSGPDGTVYQTLEDYNAAVAAAQAEAHEAAAQAGMPEPPPGITPEVRYVSDDPNSPYYWETLGYADETWVGLPIESGWYTTNPDGTQTWVQQRDLTGQAQQLHELQNIPMPDRPDLIDLPGSAPYSGIQDLIDMWNDPNRAQADKDAAIAQFEQEMGMQPGQMAQYMNQMLGDLNNPANWNGPIGSSPYGVNQEYADAANRETQLELQGMRDNYSMMLEALGAEGRNVAGFMKMDEVSRGLSTFEMQRDVQLMNTDLAMKQTEYEALSKRWTDLYNMGQMSAQQLIENMQTNRMSALQGYAQQISTLVQQNQLTLDQYRTDLEAVQVHAQTVYQGIMADIGVSEAAMNELSQRYEMYYAPYYAELERWSLEMQVEQQEEANQIAIWSAAIPGIGGLLGQAIAGSLICTELHRQGIMDDQTHMIDSIFGMLVKKHFPDVLKGYQKMARPIVRLMQKSRLFTRFINLFVKHWSAQMLWMMRCRKHGTWLGGIIIELGFRFCGRVGKTA